MRIQARSTNCIRCWCSSLTIHHLYFGTVLFSQVPGMQVWQHSGHTQVENPPRGPQVQNFGCSADKLRWPNSFFLSPSKGGVWSDLPLPYPICHALATLTFWLLLAGHWPSGSCWLCWGPLSSGFTGPGEYCRVSISLQSQVWRMARDRDCFWMREVKGRL